MKEKKIYKIEISDLEMTINSQIGILADLKISKLLKKDYGDFWMDDYLFELLDLIHEPNPYKLGKLITYHYEIRENLKTKKILREVEERLKRGL